ncbi:MAG: metal-dependent hydrolase [Alphaproteobacteria bacterium HGW-Alphaproteobacteria-18]|nr:MAG: metal-dependent hydrolase [Alphaproteobacteria bacterium HGW-Alphaproteobacteria-18]
MKQSPEDVTIIPRDIRFDVSAAQQGHWMDGDPVATAVMNTLSLTFPDGERLFIDAVRAYKDDVSGKIAQDVKDFITQEAIHSREHHMLNKVINREKYPVDRIEGMIRERIAFSRAGGPMRMLISTICLEHFTAMLADMRALHQDMFSKTDPGIERLWRWHAMEETEHKAVTYDVFMEVTKHWSPWKRYSRRCLAMALISYHFTRNIATYASWMLEADGYTPKEAQKAVKQFLWKKPGFFARGWKIWITWFKPGFHPWDHDNRELMADWKAEFDLVAAE